MEPQDRERLVRVEEGVKHMTTLLEGHINSDCNTLGCALQEDVVNLKQTQKTIRRVSWATILVALGVGIRQLTKGIFNV